MDILFDVCQFIDLHVHIGPEILPRKYTVQTLVIAEQGKIAGMALKSHFYPTIPQIKSVADTKGLILVGSITLNNYIWGLNADAIYASATLSSLPLIVWFPTINAQQFVNTSRYEIPPEWVKDPKFKPRLKSFVLLRKRKLNSKMKPYVLRKNRKSDKKPRPNV